MKKAEKKKAKIQRMFQLYATPHPSWYFNDLKDKQPAQTKKAPEKKMVAKAPNRRTPEELLAAKAAIIASRTQPQATTASHRPRTTAKADEPWLTAEWNVEAAKMLAERRRKEGIAANAKPWQNQPWNQV